MRSTRETDLKEAKKKREEILVPFVAGREVDVLRNVSARIEGRTAEIEQWEEREQPPLTIAEAWTIYVKALNRPDSGQAKPVAIPIHATPHAMLAEIPNADRGEYVLLHFAARYLREQGAVSKKSALPGLWGDFGLRNREIDGTSM